MQNTITKAADGDIPDTFPVSYNFTVDRLSNNVIRNIFWATFVLFLLTTPFHWLTSWFGIGFGDQVADWMIKTFSVAPALLLSEPWRLVTHMFMHGGLLHFGMNMLMLYTFYRSSKEFFPNKTWLIVYFGAGIIGGISFALLNAPGELAVGASGGVMGLWGAAIAARIRYTMVPADERPWQCTLTLKTLLIFLALQIGTEFLIDNVAHSAHAGGMLTGLVIGFLLPMWQQPRLVASRDGLFTIRVEVIESKLGKMVRAVSLKPNEAFDSTRDFVAVEYDRVDWLNRRTVWYEALLGNLPTEIKVDQLVNVASARTVGSETTEQYANRGRTDAEKAEETDKKKKTVNSYSITVAMVVGLLLNKVHFDPTLLPYLAAIGSLVAMSMWFLILKDGVESVRIGRLLLVVGALGAVVFGGGIAWAVYNNELAFAVTLILSVAIGHVTQRYVIMPVMLRMQKD